AAELRLPALPVLRVGWRLVSGSMVVVLLLTIYTLLTVPLFRVPGVDVSGIERLSSQEINRALRLSGTPIFLIDRQAVLGVLQSTFPELSDISVHVGFPAAITVEVGERQPVLAWEQAGVVVWVDRSGIAFPPRGIAEGLVPVQAMDAPPLVPDSDGSLPRLISPQMVAAILELSQQVPEQTTLLYDPEHGLGWADPLGWQVYFGLSPQDIPSRLAVYNAIIETLQKRRMTPVLISVEYLHAPYYRLVP
ncbi:MAG: FtsQ-type POTRA domain-containing protein, partial [Anaerolineae bacterium]|nr:FtsQ-type POTRA domain-containing protein [Anaerolineae bacterium]